MDVVEAGRGHLTIDSHGHFTTEPQALRDYRAAQLAYVTGAGPDPGRFEGLDDSELIAAVRDHQRRLQDERGTDLTLLSPRASGMGHHVADQRIATAWARASNDAVARIRDLFPRFFVPVAQLPQVTDGDFGPVIDELERCVDLGFVGCNINPDPSGGRWDSRPLTDPWWDPLWSALIRLSMPAMVHVSASASPAVHTTGAHYLAADTIVFMQLVAGDLFERFPELRLILPHGGGAAPFHWGRYRGLSDMLGKRPLTEHLLSNLFFDTCVYHQPGIDLLFDVIPTENLLFGAEILGAVRGIDPETGFAFDDTRRYVDALELDTSAQRAVFETNVRRVYPRLDTLLVEQGR